ncbi:MAG: septation protein IspZ [Fibrobacterota bacterium]
MDSSLLWAGIIPVILFIVLDSIASRKAAVYSAVVFAVLETVFTFVKFGRPDEITLLSGILIIVLGYFTLKKEDNRYFLMQPVVLGVFTAAVFFFFYYVLDKPLLNYLFYKYDLEKIYGVAIPERPLEILSRDMGFWFLLHAGILYYAAVRLGKWWWAAIRVPGLYILLIVALYMEKILFMRGIT